MTLNEFISNLQKLQGDGHGELQVFYSHSSSGECGPLSSAHVTDEQGESGPFDIEPGEKYVSISAGY